MNSNLSAVPFGNPFHRAIKLKESRASPNLFLLMRKDGVSGKIHKLTSPNNEEAILSDYK